MKSFLVLAVAGLVVRVMAADLPEQKHPFTVIAHRGCHTHAHENTLTAINHAIAAGVDYAEIDVRRTSDGHYVLMHDSTLDRMTGAHGAVASLSLAQLRKLSVRDLKRPEIPPDRIPTLGEVLSLAKGRIHLYLDFKSGDRAAVAAAIREAGVERQVLVYDVVSNVPEWRRVAPQLPLIVSAPDNLKAPKDLIDFARKTGVEVLDGYWSAYSVEMVTSAEAAGIKVWPDIQDGTEKPEYYAKVLKLGFSGAQTDHPERFVAWLKELSRR